CSVLVLLRPAPCSTLFPYTTLFRSGCDFARNGFVRVPAAPGYVPESHRPAALQVDCRAPEHRRRFLIVLGTSHPAGVLLTGGRPWRTAYPLQKVQVRFTSHDCQNKGSPPMSNVYDLAQLRAALDREFSPLKIEVDGVTLTLRNVLRSNDMDRAPVLDALSVVHDAFDEEEGAITGDKIDSASSAIE